MKSLILLIFTSLLVSTSFAQSENFALEDGQVIWQKVYDTELTRDQLIEQIKISGQFENIVETGEALTAEINQLSIDYNGYGLSAWFTPWYLSQNSLESFVLIEFKDKRYRVTLKNLKFILKEDGEHSTTGELTFLESVALRNRNTEFKEAFLRKAAKIMDFTFQKITRFDSVVQYDKW